MTEQELIELLADKEHDSWARWMKYLFSRCEKVYDGYFEYLAIPPELVSCWQRQIDTPYEQLSEQEKQSDRDEVAHILPIINEHVNGKVKNVVVATISRGGIINPLRNPLQG